MDNPGSILITGASGGIGAALALDYAAPGRFLWLSGRSEPRLEEIAAKCRSKGAIATAQTLDVTDGVAMKSWIAACDEAAPLDLVIANAGISGGGPDGAAAETIFSINLDGVLNTVLPALEAMQQRGTGQIAIMSSLASFRGLPGAPAYSASKAAVRTWGEALRARHKADGIAINVICPGFVVSQITDRNDFPMPLLMSADRAARIIRRGLRRNKARIAFPYSMYVASRLLAALPSALGDRLLKRSPWKE
jgi:short-subunit dehydrogenase